MENNFQHLKHIDRTGRPIYGPNYDKEMNILRTKEFLASPQAEYIERTLRDAHKTCAKKVYSSKEMDILRELTLYQITRSISLNLSEDLAVFLGFERYSQIDFIKEIKEKYNYDTNTAIHALANLLRITPDYCFQAYSHNTVQQDLTMKNHSLNENTHLIPKQITVLGKKYIRKFIEWQYTFSKEIEQAVVQYSNNEEESIFLLATTAKIGNRTMLTFGQRPGIAWLFSRVNIDVHHTSPIILPMTTKMSMALKKIASESKLNEEQVIVSGFLDEGKSVEALDLRPLSGKEVILIPDFSREGYLACIDFAKILKKLGCNVKIYKSPIFIDSMERDKAVSSPGSPWKISVAREGTNLYEIEVLSSFLQRILKTSISTEKFSSHLNDLGLTENINTIVSKTENKFKAQRISEMQKNGTGVNTDKIKLSEIFRVGNITLIWGPSHSGKTSYALSIGCALASGSDVFFFASNGEPTKILYIDGENTEGDALEKLNTIKSNNLQGEALDQNFYYTPLRGGEFSLEDEATQTDFIEYVRKEAYKVVFLDNLITLFSSATKNNADSFFDFVYKIEKAGAAVIFINHSKKDEADFKGPSDIASKSQTIFHIEGNTQINEDKEKSTEVEGALNSKTILLRIKCKKCKAPLELTDESCTYRLVHNEGWSYLEGSKYIDNLRVNLPILVQS